MNSDKINWMVGYAEEYEITDDRINYRGSWDCIGNIQVSPLYPHLLTRTIEGINREGIWHIGIDYRDDKKYYSETYRYDAPFTGETKVHDTPDQAKQAAIDYVFEKEQEK